MEQIKGELGISFILDKPTPEIGDTTIRAIMKRSTGGDLNDFDIFGILMGAVSTVANDIIKAHPPECDCEAIRRMKYVQQFILLVQQGVPDDQATNN